MVPQCLGHKLLFLQMLKFSIKKKNPLEENIFVKKNEEYSGIFKNYLIFENESKFRIMEFSKLNNYSTEICRNWPLYITDFWRHAGTYCLYMAI